MKPIEAKSALELTLNDIASSLSALGLYTEVRCTLCGVDFDEYNDYSEGVALISGEIFFGEAESDERAALECAVSVVDGEVSGEEMLREITEVRNEAKELIEKLSGGLSNSELMKAIAEGEDSEDNENDGGEELEYDGKRPAKKDPSPLPALLVGLGAIAAIVLLVIFL